MALSKHEVTPRVIPLEWDSKNFNLNAAKVLLKNDESKQSFEDLILEMNDYDFVTVVNENNSPVNNRLISENTDAYLVDTNVVFKKEVNKNIESVILNMSINNNMEYNQELINLVENSFVHTRFSVDPKITEKQYNAVYMNWVQNSFNSISKYFLISTDSDRNVSGFVLFNIDEKNRRITIELIVTHKLSRGTGIGISMLTHLENYATSLEMSDIVVGTQLNNIGAVHLYFRFGFRIDYVNSIYHLWRCVL